MVVENVELKLLSVSKFDKKYDYKLTLDQRDCRLPDSIVTMKSILLLVAVICSVSGKFNIHVLLNSI